MALPVGPREVVRKSRKMETSLLDRLPEPYRNRLKLSLAASGFRAEVAAKGPLLKSLFEIAPVAKQKAATLAADLAPMLDTQEGTRRLFDEQPLKIKIYEMGANQNLYVDAPAAILLLVDAAIDRLFHLTGLSLFSRGVDTYVSQIKMAQAISSLANQYKHLSEWRATPTADSKDRSIVRSLVDDPLRQDAAAEFLSRAFASYANFEDAVISCADDIVTDGTIPARGRAGVPRITMHPANGPDTK